MAFNTATFSTSGLNLLAQLSSTKSLRIKHIYIDETEHAASDFNQPPSWWASQTSTTMAKVDVELSAASVISDQARLIVKLSLKQGDTPTAVAATTVTAKTIVITACGVESGAESTEVTFCGVSDSAGVEVLYNASDIKLSTSIAVYFAFNNTSSITFADNINPDFVIHSELDRFVSCHPVGDPTGGEAQTIGGVKTFKDGAVINIADSGRLSFQYDGDEQGWISDTGSTGLQFMSSGTASGDVCFKFSDINTSDIVTISCGSDSANVPHLVEVYGKIRAESLIATTLKGTSLEIDERKISSADGGLYIDGNFAPNADRTFYLGLPNYHWKTIYSYDVNVSNGITLDVNGSNTLGTIKMVHNEDTGAMMTFGVGASLDSPNRTTSLSIYQDTIHTHKPLIAESGLHVTGGLTASKFYGDLSGCIPEPTNEWDCQRGTLCIIKASTVGGQVAYNELLRGDRIVKVDAQDNWSKVGSSQTFQIKLASFDGTVADTTPNLAIGNRFSIITSGGTDGTYLAMRI